MKTYRAPAADPTKILIECELPIYVSSQLRNHLLVFFVLFFAGVLPFLAGLDEVFFAAFVDGGFFAFGPMPTQLSTVSTTSLILPFFFAMYHSLNEGKEHYISGVSARLPQ